MNKSHEITPLMKLDHLLGALTGPDLAAKRLLLSDLGELLNRHAYTGSEPCYGFANPVIEAMPVRLEPALIQRIAQAVGPVLLDQGEVESLRVTAAFVLGKTFDPGALALVARAVSRPGAMTNEVGRQCGFAWDTLWRECGPGDPPVDLDAVEAGFQALGVPWDDVTRTVVANDL